MNDREITDYAQGLERVAEAHASEHARVETAAAKLRDKSNIHLEEQYVQTHGSIMRIGAALTSLPESDDIVDLEYRENGTKVRKLITPQLGSFVLQFTRVHTEEHHHEECHISLAPEVTGRYGAKLDVEDATFLAWTYIETSDRLCDRTPEEIAKHREDLKTFAAIAKNLGIDVDSLI